MNFIEIDEYKRIVEYMPILCVDLLVFFKNELLLLRRKKEPLKGEWWIPGGRVFKNEKLLDAAKRKAFEEIGLNPEIEPNPIFFYEFFSPKSTFEGVKTGTHTLSMVFKAIIKDENFNIQLDTTSLDYKFISKIEENLHPDLKNILKNCKIFNNVT